MSLPSTFQKIRPSLIAFCAKYAHVTEQVPPFPHIFGTGFVARSDGVILTNQHVIDACRTTFRPPDIADDDCGFIAVSFTIWEGEQLEIPLDIVGFARVNEFDGGEPYYGPDKPDLAAVVVNARELPALDIEEHDNVFEGEEIATAGFPMGNLMFTAPGWLSQLAPTLQRGIISSVLPCPGIAPHAFTINLMSQGGASGSPVFSPTTGKVLGIVYGGLNDSRLIEFNDFALPYSVPTNMTYAVPASYLRLFLDSLSEQPPTSDAQTLEQIIRSSTIRVRSRDELTRGSYRKIEIQDL